MSKPKVDQSGYQLDKKVLLEGVPLVAKGLLGGLIDHVNELDLNHDGKSDVEQVEPVIASILPLLIELAPLIKIPEFKKWIASHDWIADEKKALAVLSGLESIAVDAAKVAGH